ncbi:MAG: nucleotide pyrophosphohydrolase [Sphaerochaetaceae bacterium]|jgi:NTP pyrophosphatase (non-canonical NTP hydrolase)|nr:nucleotide pyrophosphohydrolase [Sphaerochaetaceae bacterium]MDD3942433.1 nucleotide pyrophosphohydrolase [Sphaerochaetaceae bacterium]MDX9939856.1 nucleotide pyrophosphohydrolase [Sphaerochaetaceae bacterium]
MNEIKELTDLVLRFRDERNWAQFHNPKDLAISLVLEASELLEHFQWKNGDEVAHHIEAHKDRIGEELADVLYWVLLLSHDLDLDIIEAFKAKMEGNARKYPVDKARGRHEKYTELHGL